MGFQFSTTRVDVSPAVLLVFGTQTLLDTGKEHERFLIYTYYVFMYVCIQIRCMYLYTENIN